MRTLISLLCALIALLLPATALAQTPVTVQLRQPDCSEYFTLTSASPNAVSFDNRFNGCTTWIVTYQNNGFAALSLLLQQAPDVAGVPGVWGPFLGIIVSGVNPNVSITSASTVGFGFASWVRVSATVAGAGTITGRLYGYRQSSVVPVVGPGPSGSFSVYSACNLSRPFSTALAGNQEIIPLVANQIIRVCLIAFSTFPAETVSVTYGTGANCAGATATMMGPFPNVLAMAMTPNGSSTTPASNALCINQTVAQTIGGVVTYSQYVP